MQETITSTQNRLVRETVALQQKKHRDSSGLFVAEGVRLVEEAAASGWNIPWSLYTPEAASQDRVARILRRLAAGGSRLAAVDGSLYRRISATEQPQGLLAVVQKQATNGALHHLTGNFFVVMDNVQDPGNVGTIIRTADAAGCSAIIMGRGCADVYAAKVVRATMGSLFHIPVFTGWSAGQIVTELHSIGATVFAAALETGSKECFAANLRQPCAIVLGNEGNGISKALLQSADTLLHIPMLGQAESLNVSVAAAVLIYEAVRQRQKITACW